MRAAFAWKWRVATRPGGNADAPPQWKPSRRPRNSTKQKRAGSGAPDRLPPTAKERRSKGFDGWPPRLVGSERFPPRHRPGEAILLSAKSPLQAPHHAPATASSPQGCARGREFPAAPHGPENPTEVSRARLLATQASLWNELQQWFACSRSSRESDG